MTCSFELIHKFWTKRNNSTKYS